MNKSYRLQIEELRRVGMEIRNEVVEIRTASYGLFSEEQKRESALRNAMAEIVNAINHLEELEQ